MLDSLRAEEERKAAHWHPLFYHITRSRYAAQLAHYGALFDHIDLLTVDFHSLQDSNFQERHYTFLGDVSIACWFVFVLPETANILVEIIRKRPFRMHKTAFTELVSKLRLLTPQQLAQLGTAVTDSQRRVEAVLALDARCGGGGGAKAVRAALRQSAADGDILGPARSAGDVMIAG